MPTCFVVQPFDNGKFDKRFDDIYQPAIVSAGLDAYRVDRDPHAHVPIESIEEGIRTASAVLADITLDNPNVWYELGYAFAIGTPVVMVCGAERQAGKFPFDIQHRAIVTYSIDSISDFRKLQESIKERLLAALSRGEKIRRMSETEQIAPLAGLSQAEIFVLTGIGSNVTPTSSGRPLHNVNEDIERMGLTPIGVSLGLRRLITKGLVILTEEGDFNNNTYEVVNLTEAGWEWIDQNENLFIIRRENEKPRPSSGGGRW